MRLKNRTQQNGMWVWLKMQELRFHDFSFVFCFFVFPFTQDPDANFGIPIFIPLRFCFEGCICSKVAFVPPCQGFRSNPVFSLLNKSIGCPQHDILYNPQDVLRLMDLVHLCDLPWLGDRGISALHTWSRDAWGNHPLVQPPFERGNSKGFAMAQA